MSDCAAFKHKLAALNLDPINYILSRSPDGPHWTINQIHHVEKWYRRFHELVYLYPGHQIVPTKHIDEYWHHHILDTEKYQADCLFLHGRLVHHFPYLGIGDRTTLVALYENMLSLFETTYGDSPVILRELFTTIDYKNGSQNLGDASSDASLCGSACIKTLPSMRGFFGTEKIPAIAGISDRSQ